ncbi:MAG: zinc dependent phospholipase C family protein [Candidatus Thorarchaeota archaeon]
MKKSGLVLAILLVSLVTTITVVPQPKTAHAWGWATHQFIVSEAIDGLTNESWRKVFDFYTPEILAGSIHPDAVWQDWDNHLYYPHNNTHNAPSAAERWYNNTRDNFTAGNWEAGFFALGIMSHYFQDPHIPVHTDSYWPGHPGYEDDINENLDILTFNPPTETLVTNVSQLVVDGAIHAHQYYPHVYEQYSDGSSRAIQSNATIKALTEDCLSLAINGCLSLYYNLTQYTDAPDVWKDLNYVALVDYAHGNDYINYQGQDKLTSINYTLAREGFELRKQVSAFTPGDLVDVDLLIFTCGLDAYTTAELTAIGDWSASGNKSMIVVGSGDYNVQAGYVDLDRPNELLQAVGANIRINEDNVYMDGTYQDWYNDIYTIPNPEDTLNLTLNVDSFTFFSPASLYFLDDDPVLPVIYGDESAYQTNQNLPPITDIYDDVQDGIYGDQIPLAAVEEIDSFRLLVGGATFFSDFDYGSSEYFDNVEFLENFLDWAAGNRSEDNIPLVDETGPRVGDVSWDPAAPIEGQLVNVTAIVTDPGGVDQVFLEYESTTIEMNHVSGDTYEVRVPGVTSGSLSFRIEANDTSGNIAVRASFSIDWTPATTTTSTTTTTTTETTTTTTTTAPPPPPPEIPMTYLIVGAVVALGLIALAVACMRRR